MKINLVLKELRMEGGLRQSDVAKALGVSRTAYSNYELGIREPSLEMVVKLCDLFNVSADYMLGRIK